MANKHWQRCGEKRVPLYCQWERNWCYHWGKQYDGFSKKKTKVELPCVPVIPLLGVCMTKMKILIHKNMNSLMLIATLFNVANI